MKCVYHQEEQCRGNLDCSMECFTNPLRNYTEDNNYDKQLISTLEIVKDELVREL